jgi:Outer membrane cobalamin receptor protein
MRNKKMLLMLILCNCALGISAQQKVKKDSSMVNTIHQLNPVVVTGNGHHEYLRSSTTPVHVITTQEIQKQGISTFNDALTRLMPNIEFMPNAMGSYLRQNGLGNKYVLILINGKKLVGDISGNVDIDRINIAQIKRIEVLNGAASSLYGSDAIGGVINIITDQPKSELISVTTNSRFSGKGQNTQSVNLNINYRGFGSYTNFKHAPHTDKDNTHSYLLIS